MHPPSPAHQHVCGSHQRRQRAVALLPPQRILRAMEGSGEGRGWQGSRRCTPLLGPNSQRHPSLCCCTVTFATRFGGQPHPNLTRKGAAHLAVVVVVIVQARQLLLPVRLQRLEAGGGGQRKALRGRAGGGQGTGWSGCGTTVWGVNGAYSAECCMAGGDHAWQLSRCGWLITQAQQHLLPSSSPAGNAAHWVKGVGVLRVPQQYHVLPQAQQAAPHRLHLLRRHVGQQAAARRDGRQCRLAAGCRCGN